MVPNDLLITKRYKQLSKTPHMNKTTKLMGIEGRLKLTPDSFKPCIVTTKTRLT